nr:sulfurtransferase [Thermoleptolyngbya sichuanensis]
MAEEISQRVSQGVSPDPVPNPAAVVTADWLLDHLDDPGVAIADCRFSLMEPDLGRQQYHQGHIPGAVYFDLNADLSGPVQRHGGRHPLPHSDALAQTLAAAGITRGETWVIAYDDSRLGFASRFWWLLRYLGHDRVAVLDGGFAHWQAAGYPVTAATAPSTPRQAGQFVPALRPEMVVDIETVKQRKDRAGVVLVDSREGDRYRGEREPIDPIAGHIPGAVNYPWQGVTDDRGRVLSVEAQRQRWQNLSKTKTNADTNADTNTDTNEIDEAEEIIVYCGSGVTACVNLLSLEMAGRGSQSKLYAGSWSDWCSYLVDESGTPLG